MIPFDPTLPPAGRLARLGLVLDLRGETVDPRHIAALADRAGIGAVWLGHRRPAGHPVEDLWRLAGEIGPALRSARLGVLLHPEEAADVDSVATQIESLAGSEHSPEIGVSWPEDSDIRVAATLQALRSRFGSRTTASPRLSGMAAATAAIGELIDVADDIILPHTALDLETATDEARAEAAEHGRDPSTLGVAALVPVSVGRTQAEATARIHMDPDFRRFGDPAIDGIFGTLEECQDRVIALAHAGVTDLRCILPSTPDVIDVIAQLTALTIGTTDVLVPGSLRSPAPAPPEGWGGRPDRPAKPGVSGGSRRR